MPGLGLSRVLLNSSPIIAVFAGSFSGKCSSYIPASTKIQIWTSFALSPYAIGSPIWKLPNFTSTSNISLPSLSREPS